MYYVISQSTDDRCPRTTVYKTSSIANAKKRYSLIKKELDKRDGFTYFDPDSAKNWHHTLVYLYELKGRVNQKDPIFLYRGSSTYPVLYNDNMFRYIREYGEEIEI